MKHRWTRTRVIITLIALAALPAACRPGDDRFPAAVSSGAHPWVVGKKLFIDPGHGGMGARDRFRQGPNGITEEVVNLRVALVLRDLLRRAGAVVLMSREDDRDVTLAERVRMAQEFSPDLLVSIHHNGSMRRVDDVNYPLVFFWGTREVNPAGFALAAELLPEFERIMTTRGRVLSDFSVFSETGSRILRETRDICPGVIGECGFFTHPVFAVKLNDALFHVAEAEAYFTALSRYLKRGLPGAEAVFSCPVDNSSFQANQVMNPRADLVITARKNRDDDLVQEGTLTATLDGLPVVVSRQCAGAWRVHYGPELHPGAHRLRFRFMNRHGQDSMILNAGFSVAIRSGDHERLAREGRRLAAYPSTVHRGLAMLLAAFSMGLTDPDDDRLLLDISRAFALAGDRASAHYYAERLARFYPQSPRAASLPLRTDGPGDYRFPVDHIGRAVIVRGINPSRGERLPSDRGRWWYFFYGQ